MNNIFTVTTIDSFQVDRFNSNQMMPLYDRTVCYRNTLESAKEVVETNMCDIWETCYDYAVIQEVPPFIYPEPINTWWYKWNKENQQYEPIECPNNNPYNEIICFAIG